MKRAITVLQDDIDNGIRESVSRCAIARAANRDLADLLAEENDPSVSDVRVSVNAGMISLLRNERSGNFGISWATHSGELPLDACDFIQDFDGGARVEPFKFEIEIEAK
jgi:hypothetical protein